MAHYDVVVYKTAEADIQGIINYISTGLREPKTAYNTTKRFREEILSLSNMPERYDLLADKHLASSGIQACFSGNYLIFYTVDKTGHQVNILRVLHGRRNWEQLLNSPNSFL